MSLKDPFEDKEWKILEDDWEDELIVRPARDERNKWEEIDDDESSDEWLEDDSEDDEDWSDLEDDEVWEDVDEDEDDDFDE